MNWRCQRSLAIAFIRDIMKRGKKYKITPYGVEALNVMRIEKGHFTGAELTGQTTALNLNFGADGIGKKGLGWRGVITA